MKKHPPTSKPSGGVVWRISEQHPQGQWVRKDAPLRPAPAPAQAPSDPDESTWAQSSFDLLSGTVVIERKGALALQFFEEQRAKLSDKAAPSEGIA